LVIGGEVLASNMLYVQRLKGMVPIEWTQAGPLYGEWTKVGDVYGCSNWSPDTSAIAIGRAFTQSASDCKQDQTRTVQNRERETYSGALRNVGEPYAEARTIAASSSRQAVGTLETWQPTDPTYTAWTNSGAVYACSNWSPATSTVTIGESFTQTANDCKQDQTRARQDRERETTTGEIRNAGTPVTENRTVVASATRQATGTKETWTATTPTYTDWANSGTVYACSNWSPAPSTVTIGLAFTQTATDCKQDQTRSRQERERESTTGEIRNAGAPVTETRTITADATRQAAGTKETWVATTPTYTAWTNSGSVTGCTNWSPATSTVTIGQAFTQTATDCDQKQTRTRQERERETTTGEIRNVGIPVTETQTIKVSATRQATGTKETWTATTPTYTSWVNSGAVYGCSNWSPATSTVTIGESFTQTANDCSQNQTRTRQDREQETTTGEIRNVGTPVIETRTIAASSTRQATGTKETWVATTPTYSTWTNSGSVTGCTNWSPAPSTVTIGQSFTQTATDCKQAQTRTRQDREVETTTGAIRNAGSPVTETQTITVSSTRQATGTKETWAATTPTYTSWVNSGAVYGCTNWSPATSTVTIGQAFTQTATDCSQNQTRTRQDREQETTTGEIRNVGTPVTETRTIAASSTRQATGTKETWVATTPTYTAWTNSGSITGCTNWSPATSTVTIGQAFTQTATDCKQAQTRTRQDREVETTTGAIRNAGSPATETQTITVSSTRQATGTKETWVAISPTYSTWANSGSVYNCTAWSPSPDTVNSGTSFTQTRSCSQNQVRTVQNREQETTTKEIRNTTTSSESQVVTVSQSQTAIGTKPLAVVPSINSFSATATWNRITCGWVGNASWSGSNVASYTVSWPAGSAAKGTATSHSVPSTSNKSNVAGTWTLKACSSTGDCVTSSISASVGSQGSCN